MDRNGYNESIVQRGSRCCYLCGNTHGKLDRHEIWGGALRAKSKEYGLWVLLCHIPCHLGLAHGDRETQLYLRRMGQAAAMREYNMTTDDFISFMGRNYL